ncbi:MAG: hypothetical protein NC416_15225 [Eubacterium sp.]|nr:hypothetical protein [Eubacterium sp.]
MISSLSDDNVSFLIEIIQRLMPGQKAEVNRGMQAFNRLEAARQKSGSIYQKTLIRIKNLRRHVQSVIAYNIDNKIIWDLLLRKREYVIL